MRIFLDRAHPATAGQLPEVRLRTRTVASDLLHQILPPLTFACEGFVVSGLLQPGDRIVVHTDGVTEARDPALPRR